MRRLAVLLAVLAVALTGCIPEPSVPAATVTTSTTPARTGPPGSASPDDATTPPSPRLPGEVARSTVGEEVVESVVGDLPRGAHDLYVHAACVGPVGSRLRYRTEDGDGRRFGLAGDVVCSGDRSVAGTRVTDPPRRARVVVEAPTGVRGWAVLSTSAEGAD